MKVGIFHETKCGGKSSPVLVDLDCEGLFAGERNRLR